MQKATRVIYLLLRITYVITVLSILLAWIGGDKSFFELVFGAIGILGFPLCILLFFAHVLVLILAFIFKSNNRER